MDRTPLSFVSGIKSLHSSSETHKTERGLRTRLQAWVRTSMQNFFLIIRCRSAGSDTSRSLARRLVDITQYQWIIEELPNCPHLYLPPLHLADHSPHSAFCSPGWGGAELNIKHGNPPWWSLRWYSGNARSLTTGEQFSKVRSQLLPRTSEYLLCAVQQSSLTQISAVSNRLGILSNALKPQAAVLARRLLSIYSRLTVKHI